MRYGVFLPDCKGGYKVGEAGTLEEALFLSHQQAQRHNEVCLIYDSQLKTYDLKRMMKDKLMLE